MTYLRLESPPWMSKPPSEATFGTFGARTFFSRVAAISWALAGMESGKIGNHDFPGKYFLGFGMEIRGDMHFHTRAKTAKMLI